ncbi:MAG: hypothetical protein WA950_12520 [Shinella sp.]|uniref:hypothetical protein n=1 Tax=Shinella sp. TaxID=1870904 RepID=UPI003C750025
MSTPRRNVLRMIAATPFIAGGVRAVEDQLTPKERAEHHWNAYVAAMNELTTEFDGWILNAGARYSDRLENRTNFRSLQSVRLHFQTSSSNKILIERHSPLTI